MHRVSTKLIKAAPLLLAWLLLAAAGTVSARQVAGSPPPTILSFTSDLASVTVDDAEAGMKSAALAWTTAGVTGDYRLALESYEQRRWVPLVDINTQPLSPNGVFVVSVRALCGFCPPTYRLSIINSQAQILDQRTVSIPFQTQGVGTPQIVSFTTGVQGVDANSLAQRAARVTVFWQVRNRLPDSNLVFEQVMADGSAVPVELPRAELWVPSSGQGETAPTLPQLNSFVRLRLRVVNALDGATYAESTLDIPMTGAATAPAANPPAQPLVITGSGEAIGGGVPSDGAPPPAQILYFSANPGEVDRGGTVTVTWSVANARSLIVARLNPEEQFADIYPNPAANGTWTLALPTYYADSVPFYLVAIGADDGSVSSQLNVRVRCPFAYFFGEDRGAGCPQSGPLDVDAAYQTFERGFMIWRGDTRQIFVLDNNGGAGVYPDTWTQGEAVNILSATPSGLYAPERGFAKVWLAAVEVMNGLGWGTAPELAYSLRVQESANYRDPRTYLTLPDGRVIAVADNTWRVLGQQQG